MDDLSKAVDTVFNNCSDSIVLGLTGRTGSGCTTAAMMLQQETINTPAESQFYNTDNDKRKYKIVCDYVENNWAPFILIQVTNVITSFILEIDFSELCVLLAESNNNNKENIESKLINFKTEYTKHHKLINKYKLLPEKNEKERSIKSRESFKMYFDIIPDFTEKFKKELHDNISVDAYVNLYQRAGDNIRASGKANKPEFDPNNLFFLPKIISKIIRVVARETKQKPYIVIDAIRNPYEAEFLKQKHANFYLISINTPNIERLRHLSNSHKYSADQITKLDNKEYPKKLSRQEMFVSQNIQKCIEMSDIHINNPSRERCDQKEMASQLCWYVSLIIHPGLVTPTSLERGMQLAFSSKLNSGCISRQVGAVVTDKNYSIKAVGWNSVPEGQVPCLFRNAEELLCGGDKKVYSTYENNNEDFRDVLEQTYKGVSKHKNLSGRNLSYCFKDLHNEVEGEKNQVHTRSLHAEENAFLQLAKYGGQSVKGGVLFTTASPCELCSKKAYQLGISKVVYIDPYPGIANEHILDCGLSKPKLELFSGAVGQAYHRLYEAKMSFKDELKLLTGYTVTGGKKRNMKDLKISKQSEKIKELEEKLNKLENK